MHCKYLSCLQMCWLLIRIVVTFAPVSKCTHTKEKKWIKNNLWNAHEALTNAWILLFSSNIESFFTFKQAFSRLWWIKSILKHQPVFQNKNTDMFVFKNNLSLFSHINQNFNVLLYKSFKKFPSDTTVTIKDTQPHAHTHTTWTHAHEVTHARIHTK